MCSDAIMVSSVDGKIREQFAAKIQEADWTLAQAQQMAAQMPPGLVAGQAFKVMSPDDWPTWCKYDGQQVLVLGGKDAYRAAVQVADEELAAVLPKKLLNQSGVNRERRRGAEEDQG